MGKKVEKKKKKKKTRYVFVYKHRGVSFCHV